MPFYWDLLQSFRKHIGLEQKWHVIFVLRKCANFSTLLVMSQFVKGYWNSDRREWWWEKWHQQNGTKKEQVKNIYIIPGDDDIVVQLSKSDITIPLLYYQSFVCTLCKLCIYGYLWRNFLETSAENSACILYIILSIRRYRGYFAFVLRVLGLHLLCDGEMLFFFLCLRTKYGYQLVMMVAMEMVWFSMAHTNVYHADLECSVYCIYVVIKCLYLLLWHYCAFKWMYGLVGRYIFGIPYLCLHPYTWFPYHST